MRTNRVTWRWEEQDFGFRLRAGKGKRTAEYHQAARAGEFYIVPKSKRKLKKDPSWLHLTSARVNKEFAKPRCPADAWAAQQLREATACCSGPKYLIRDNDDKFGKRFAAVAEDTEIEVVKIPPRAPNRNPICERFLGSVRRECLDHVVILSDRQLRRVLKAYVEIYFNRARPHQGLWQGIPVAGSRAVPKVGGKVVPIPMLGGLHHDYQLAA